MTKKVILRDSTLREGLDTPNVRFSLEHKLRIARRLDEANVPEAEVVAPSRVGRDLLSVERIKGSAARIRLSGLIYAYKPDCDAECEAAARLLDRFDLLMPVSPHREPSSLRSKITMLTEALGRALECHGDVGVGLPHATQVPFDLLREIAREAAGRGARRLTIYDTNGSADPLGIYHLIKKLREEVDAPILFHGHNDLGMATANSLAAVQGGADALDVTVNGLGDRAGNASLEQVALALHLRGFDTGISLESLRLMSRTVELASGVALSPLAPVVGEYIFQHKSPSHLSMPELFEAFDPDLLHDERNTDPDLD
jgi:isopropylmalate/homocitrate/citramalate synthase